LFGRHHRRETPGISNFIESYLLFGYYTMVLKNVKVEISGFCGKNADAVQKTFAIPESWA
jgi:hypothetical protein